MIHPQTLTDRQRIRESFQSLVHFDAESGSEAAIAAYLREKLCALGLMVTQDAAGNLFAVLKATRAGESVLFCAHMDTVSPGRGKRAILYPDGIFHSDGTTVLGADDAAGLSAILEALMVIRDKKLAHPRIEVLFTVKEELYCHGSAAFDFGVVTARDAYVLDLTGKIGTVAVAAPSILSLDILVYGRAAHAGFEPEAGINALTAAARALAALDTGRVEADTTVNFGTISGGSGKNVVPAEVRIHGEIRSMRHERALAAAETIRARFEAEARKLGGKAELTVTEEIHAYRVKEDAPVLRRLHRALERLGCGEAKLVDTFGGSDNNRFHSAGVCGVVLACAMENVHTTAETCDLDELQKSAELTLMLMTMEETAQV